MRQARRTDMELGLAGKVCVVAGGSRGCGRGIAEVLAAEGARVVLSGRMPDKVRAAEAAIRATGADVRGVVADMTTPAGARLLHAAAVDAFGDPQVLVVNSPGAVPDPET